MGALFFIEGWGEQGAGGVDREGTGGTGLTGRERGNGVDRKFAGKLFSRKKISPHPFKKALNHWDIYLILI
jgi:hypothetical protein